MITLEYITTQSDFGLWRTDSQNATDAITVLNRLYSVMKNDAVTKLVFSIKYPSQHYVKNMEFIYNIYAWLVKHRILAH